MENNLLKELNQLLAKMQYRYTKSELEKLLDNIVVLIDTREKKNNHITNYLNRKEISFKKKKLDF